MVAFIQVQCVFEVMKSVVAGRNLRAVVIQGTFYIEKCMGGIGVVASSEWSPTKSGRMDRFDCISVQHINYKKIHLLPEENKLLKKWHFST